MNKEQGTSQWSSKVKFGIFGILMAMNLERYECRMLKLIFKYDINNPGHKFN